MEDRQREEEMRQMGVNPALAGAGGTPAWQRALIMGAQQNRN